MSCSVALSSSPAFSPARSPLTCKSSPETSLSLPPFHIYGSDSSPRSSAPSPLRSRFQRTACALRAASPPAAVEAAPTPPSEKSVGGGGSLLKRKRPTRLDIPTGEELAFPPAVGTDGRKEVEVESGRFSVYCKRGKRRLEMEDRHRAELDLHGDPHMVYFQVSIIPFLANALLHDYARCSHPNLASQLFDQMSDRDVVSYTTLVLAYTHNNTTNSTIVTFLNMLTSTSTPSPNKFTLAVILQACMQSHNKQLAQVLHAYLLTTGFITDQFTSNSLPDSYSKSCMFIDAEKLLYELDCRGVVSWSIVIAGCVLNGALNRALQLFVCMLEDDGAPNASTQTCLSC